LLVKTAQFTQFFRQERRHTVKPHTESVLGPYETKSERETHDDSYVLPQLVQNIPDF